MLVQVRIVRHPATQTWTHVELLSPNSGALLFVAAGEGRRRGEEGEWAVGGKTGPRFIRIQLSLTYLSLKCATSSSLLSLLFAAEAEDLALLSPDPPLFPPLLRACSLLNARHTRRAITSLASFASAARRLRATGACNRQNGAFISAVTIIMASYERRPTLDPGYHWSPKYRPLCSHSSAGWLIKRLYGECQAIQ